MKKFAMIGAMTVMFCSASMVHAEQKYTMPKPGKEHKWLHKLVGNWRSVVKVYMAPGKPPTILKGTESYRAIGGFWVAGTIKGKMMGHDFTALTNYGYDTEKKGYVATWIDSMGGHLWNYTGAVDTSGKTITLNTEGPCPMTPGKPAKFQETTRFDGNNHKVWTSKMLGADGKWTTMMVVDSHRVK